jgi:ribonuclease III
MTGERPVTNNPREAAIERVSGLEKAINYTFSDKSLALTALTHSSIARLRHASNERLEFLGDRVLGLIIAEMLFRQFPNEEEGALGYRFPALVRAEALARIAMELDLGAYLLIDDNQFAANQKRQTSVLSNACEAVIAALYLDGGLAAAQTFIETHWQALLEEDLTPPKDAKTLLQELVQQRGLPVPAYRVVERTGPDHAPEFTIEVSVEREAPATAKGASKRAAETAAALQLYNNLTGHPNND